MERDNGCQHLPGACYSDVSFVNGAHFTQFSRISQACAKSVESGWNEEKQSVDAGGAVLPLAVLTGLLADEDAAHSVHSFRTTGAVMYAQRSTATWLVGIWLMGNWL